ncbi:hypothetical protein H2O64_07880 [Kordia sp. YSTF-M3]|uniref:Outer membrane protein beta-barrel domain-containing protein n=1 Tax=Kordia aestuariivivens TaxID=2759037 RepID=A0ABR7Q7R2_9FLAO|nr:hypothetical protein [Kordia aestuariivivens]MBC8754589.1 hypothetical protein [Kordia aestuariivivens]
MPKYILFFLLISFTANAQVQNDSLVKKKKFQLNPWDNINGYRVSFNSLRTLELEASYVLSSFPKKDPGFGAFAMRFQYISAGVEYLRLNRQDVYGIKLAYENSFSLISAQIGTDYLFSNNDSQIRLMPKVGITMIGWITLYYGWNINLLKNSSLQPSNHSFSLQFTFPIF